MSQSFSPAALLPALGSSSPRDGAVVWLLQGARLGDNQQVLALGAALEARFGWRLVVKQLKFARGPVPGSDPADGLRHVKLAESDPLHATETDPWPDLIIAVGRRAAPVARWIKTHNAPYCIHVQIGRFQDPFATVDLLVTTAQYALPGGPNVLHLSLPMTARKPDALAAAAKAYAPLFDGVAQPSIGVLVGGPSNPIKFGAKDGEKLAREALAFADKTGARLLVATSPRTPPEVVAHLQATIRSPHVLFAFEPGLGDRNPYPALLARCHSFIVTNDSVSMVADAALTGREVRVFDLPVARPRALWKPSWPIAHWLGRRRNQRLVRGAPADMFDRWFEGEVRAARAQPTRYVPIIMARLLRERHVALMNDPLPPRTDLAELVARELDMVSARVMALLAERRTAALRARLTQGGALAARAMSPRAEINTALGLPQFG
ncbi:ELM1/GtrOC1 family putative glycosyltransferase [Dongia rigui]|uniref:ELM1/GtrOC1 family putative glycosyltransferase n=1 Tax=Dongia rigui TaxID=940149 RepID=A0ABU5DYU6_9PROT|nr:ELM1/GtrOC1 family putative glycosyltransferase [Dongia rigui]MDY0872090.1 ELM1/GtrOC1 family putative glycosyltransferase [Dongia rigui]